MTSGDEQPLIELRGVVKDFPLGHQTVRALAGVDLAVRAQEFLVVMGPSGSGKSTLLNLIGGLDRPTEGRIVVEGRELGELDEIDLAAYRRDVIGFVFQSFNLIPTMTASQNVEFPMLFAGRRPAARRERAERLLAQVGLGQRAHHRPVELSGGEQQRVAIARAAANSPRILLGDEPTGNLDTHTGHEILQLLAAINQAGRTVIVVSHDHRLADFAHRVITMEDGRVTGESRGRPTLTE